MNIPNRSRFRSIMSAIKPFWWKNTVFAAALLASGSLAISPFVMPAFAASTNMQSSRKSNDWLNTFTPAGVDRLLAGKFVEPSGANNARFPFTLVGRDANRNRTIIVAARASSRLTDGAVSIRGAITMAEPGVGKALRLSAIDYRLTAAKGWQGFKLPTAPKLSAVVPLSELGRGNFRLEDNAKKSGKFNTSVKFDQHKDTAPSARGSAAANEYKLDVGGSFSISRKIDLTAGVRYTSDNERVMPITDNRKDSEAVYVGTKIRF